MRPVIRLGLLVVLALLSVPGASSASEPPNHKDPCAHTGRNVCATAGVGYYKTYRYGLRWFGDFRGVGTADRHLYCIDLRYWYPSSSFRYAATTGGVLRNRDGKVVSLVKQAQIAYAIFTFGQTTSRDQAAAVMLYVHSLIGDGRPGETDPKALGARVTKLYQRIARAAARLRGPYTIRTRVTGGGVVGAAGDVRVEVVSATGALVPGVTIAVAATGASGVPATVRADAKGIAHVPFHLTTTAGFHVVVRTARLPLAVPRILAPTTNAAVANAQRLAAADGARLAADVRVEAAPAQIQATTSAAPSSLLVGGQSTEHVTITGALPGWSGTVTATLYGPFPTEGDLAAPGSCAGTPFAQVTFPATGLVSEYDAPPVAVTAPGWYTWVDDVPGDANDTGVTTDCGVPAESFHVDVTPAVVTTVSDARVAPGTAISDSIVVTGLSGLTATVQAALYGPFPSPAAITCDGTPAWQGTVTATGDGTYRTDPFSLTVAGYYSYREWIVASGVVHAAETACADVAETVVAVATPGITTQVNAAQARPGAALTDAVTVTALGAVSVDVSVDLYGPYPTAAAIDCSGTPAATSTLIAIHDGTYTSAATHPLVAGYYAYREVIAPGPANDGVTTPCAAPGETAYIRAAPTITTTANSDVVRVGSSVTDAIVVRGLGRTAATIDIALYGPFAARAAITCTGTPTFARSIQVAGDGIVRSPAARITHVGFYAWTEHLRGTALIRDTTTACGLVDETSFGAAGISTGRGDVVLETRARRRSSMAPVRVRIARPGVDAPVIGVGLDMAHGLLGVPANVRRTGWWTDGALPGSRAGAVLIGGHVDSAAAGPGAFAPLSLARKGDLVEVTTAGGRVVRYRVTSVRSYLKRNLPTNVWSLRGRARLVLVTCGGTFDTRTRHYLDNIVVTAVPISR